MAKNGSTQDEMLIKIPVADDTAFRNSLKKVA
jgi:hypothetical protein